MNTFKYKLLEKVVQWLSGREVYEAVKDVVEALMDSSLSGEEKRRRAWNIIRPTFSKVSGVLINLAIETAVAVLKAKINKD